VAVDFGNDRLFAIEQREDDALGLPGGLTESVVDHLLHPEDVAARGKGAPFAGEHDDVRIPVVRRILEHGREFGVHDLVDGIQLIGSVERQREDAPATIDADRPVFREVDHAESFRG
jgi:hypothetical protein